MNCIQQDIDYEKFDEDLYKFVDILIANYSDDIFYQLVQYFLMLYGKKNVTEASRFQIAYFSELFCTFSKLNENQITFSALDWNAYRKQCETARMKEELQKIKLEQKWLKEEKIRRYLYESAVGRMDF